MTARGRQVRKAASISTALRNAISEREIPLLALEKATGVKRQSIMWFLRGERSLRLTAVDSLAAFFGLELVQREENNMSRHADTQEDRVAKVKAFLKTRPGVACSFIDIRDATGVPKSRIDYLRSLSGDDADVRRTEAKGNCGVRWTYIGPT